MENQMKTRFDKMVGDVEFEFRDLQLGLWALRRDLQNSVKMDSLGVSQDEVRYLMMLLEKYAARKKLFYNEAFGIYCKKSTLNSDPIREKFNEIVQGIKYFPTIGISLLLIRNHINNAYCAKVYGFCDYSVKMLNTLLDEYACEQGYIFNPTTKQYQEK